MTIQPLNDRVPIINDDGTPTQYFIRMLKERGITVDEKITEAEAIALINESLATHSVNAGPGLSGGGTLDTNPTLSLDAGLDDLNDVDLSTPPTNGQALVYDGTSSLWKAGTVSGGGGGGAPGWQLITSWDFAVSGAIASIIVPVGGYSEIYVFGSAVTTSVSSWRGARYSVDGGATYSSASVYSSVANAGTLGVSDTADFYHATNTTAARYWQQNLSLIDKTGVAKKRVSNRTDSNGIFGTSATSTLGPITHVRISPIDAAGAPVGTFNGGQIFVFGIPTSSGTPGVWQVINDTTIGAPVAAVTADVTGYSEVEIIARDLTASVSGSRSVRVSTDGGLTYWSVSGNYQWYNFSGALTNNNCFALHAVSSTAARGGVARITNLRDTTAPKAWQTPNNSDHGAGIFVATNAPITHVQILNLASGNLTGGRVIVSGLKV